MIYLFVNVESVDDDSGYHIQASHSLKQNVKWINGIESIGPSHEPCPNFSSGGARSRP